MMRRRMATTWLPVMMLAGAALLPGGVAGWQRGSSSIVATLSRIPELADYALQYRAQGMIDEKRSEEAEVVFRQLAREHPTSLLARQAMLQAAGSAFLRGAHQTALDDLRRLIEKGDGTALKLAADIEMKRGRREEASRLLRRLYYEAPQTAEAEKAPEALAQIGVMTLKAGPVEMRGRADRLYQAGMWLDAATAYQELARLHPEAAGEEVPLRRGIASYKGNEFREAVAVLEGIHSRSMKTTSEALYHLGMARLSLQSEAGALEVLARLRRATPESSRIADLLYGLGRYYEKRDRPGEASTYFSELVKQFPGSEWADEAHFFVAWRAHLSKNYGVAGRLLTEHLASYGERTENRGRAGFWAAADTERSGNKGRALTLYRGLLMRYGAGWYGINAERRIARLEKENVEPVSIQTDQTLRRALAGMQSIRIVTENLGPFERERIVKAEQLTRLQLHQSAMNELEAARAGGPDSPTINLRIAKIHQINGENVTAINVLKRAYPDYGQALPDELPRAAWEVFYPLKYWPQIREEAKRQGLDPYQIAGIIRQETVFNPAARSRANAIGLMQLLPSTGQAVARKNSLGGGRISTADLYNPVLNLQLGVAYVRELVERFDRFEYVAAAYNGGPTRVSRWINELPGDEIEEWVESIPLTETRLYVQGVFRNIRQYQRLYDEKGNFRPINR